jgi:hypothetical protein
MMRASLRACSLLAALVPAACFIANPLQPYEPPIEICGNAIDDDGDGLADCDQPRCATRPECAESGVKCRDGIDNDLDDVIDCAEPACERTLECFMTAELRMACPLPEKGRELIEPFSDGLDRWIARPEINPPFLDQDTVVFAGAPAGRPSLTLRETVRFGATHPLWLAFLLEMSRVSQSTFFVAQFVHEETGRAVLALRVTPLLDGRFQLECTHHGRTTLSGPLERFAWITLAVDAQGMAVAKLGDELGCVAGPLEPLEVETRFELWGPFEGTARVNELELSVAPQASPCIGVGEPVLAPGFCVDEAIGSPNIGFGRVTNVPGGFALLERVMTSTTGDDSAPILARRDAGATAWEVTPIELDMNFDLKAAALTFDAFDRELELWHARTKVTFSIDDPASLTRSETVTLHTRSGVELGQLLIAAARLPTGTYVGVFAKVQSLGDRPAHPGFRELTTAHSADGVEWIGGETALAATDWESGGFLPAASLSWTGDFLLLAYTAETFPYPPAIGLAASRDGVVWQRHPANPILRHTHDAYLVPNAMLLELPSTPAALTARSPLIVWFTVEPEREESIFQSGYWCTDPTKRTIGAPFLSARPWPFTTRVQLSLARP